VVSAYAARHQVVPICTEWWCTEANEAPKLTAIIQSRRLTLFGHIIRMDDNADAKRILLASAPADWRRQLGCPRITWLSTIQQDLKHHHLTLPEAANLAQNRPLWRMMSTYGATQSWVACQKRRTTTIAKFLVYRCNSLGKRWQPSLWNCPDRSAVILGSCYQVAALCSGVCGKIWCACTICLSLDLLYVQWAEFMQLGDNVPDSVVEERIRTLAPNQCCSLIFTVSFL